MNTENNLPPLCLRYLPPLLRGRQGIFAPADSNNPRPLLVRLVEHLLEEFIAASGESAIQRGDQYLRLDFSNRRLVLVVTRDLVWRMHISDDGTNTDASLSLNCAAAGSGEFLVHQEGHTQEGSAKEGGAKEGGVKEGGVKERNAKVSLEVVSEPGNTVYHKLMKLNGRERIFGVMRQLMADAFYTPTRGSRIPDYSSAAKQWADVQRDFIESFAAAGLITNSQPAKSDSSEAGKHA